MANVFLTDEAYARLKAAKKQGQSFSDVILDTIPQEIDWEKHLGSWKGADVKKLMAEIKAERR